MLRLASARSVNAGARSHSQRPAATTATTTTPAAMAATGALRAGGAGGGAAAAFLRGSFLPTLAVIGRYTREARDVLARK
jgi:hypothetical protein